MKGGPEMLHPKITVSHSRLVVLVMLLLAIFVSCGTPSLRSTETVSPTYSTTSPPGSNTVEATWIPTLSSPATTTTIAGSLPTSPVITQMPSTVSPKPEFSVLAEWNIEEINEVAWSPDSTKFAVAFGEGVIYGIRLYDANSLQEIWSVDTGMAYGIAFSPNGQKLATSPTFTSVQLRDVSTGKTDGNIFDDEYNCMGDFHILFSPNGHTIITTRSDGGRGYPYQTLVYFWDADKSQCIGKFTEEEGWLGDIALSPDGQLLALALSYVSADEGNQVRVWDINTRQKICEFPGRWAEFSPVDNLLATANLASSEIELWDAEECFIVQSLDEDISPISLAFSPDGQLLASGRQSVQIWDINSGELVRELTGLPNDVQKLAFSPDGRYLLSVTKGVTVDQGDVITLWEIIP